MTHPLRLLCLSVLTASSFALLPMSALAQGFDREAPLPSQAAINAQFSSSADLERYRNQLEGSKAAREAQMNRIAGFERDIAGLSARERTLRGQLERSNSELERFASVWKPEWDARVKAMGISRHDAITMASIVEKEARKPEERALISAVYWNRVKKGMLLQADPTVQYALPQHVERVYFKDLEVESKYNTYKYVGLPPGPIASPGEASIAAALAPAEVPYLFFVARADGSHEFRTEHQQAIADIKRARQAKQAK